MFHDRTENRRMFHDKTGFLGSVKIYCRNITKC
jgi:hypothetical protein